MQLLKFHSLMSKIYFIALGAYEYKKLFFLCLTRLAYVPLVGIIPLAFISMIVKYRDR